MPVTEKLGFGFILWILIVGICVTITICTRKVKDEIADKIGMAEGEFDGYGESDPLKCDDENNSSVADV